MTGALTLLDGSCPELVDPHVPAGRAAEITRALAAIHGEFAREQEAGLETLERNLRAWTTLHTRDELAERTLDVAAHVRKGFRAFVHVGIGGSDLGPRVCHEVLDHTRFNELDDETRGAPRIYFAGDTFDPRPLAELLDLLDRRGDLPATAFNIVSKSGKTPETLCALLAIKDRLGPQWARQVVLTTGDRPGESILFDLAAGDRDRFAGILPVPEGVGGRFSVPSPVGLLPLAVATDKNRETPLKRVQEALAGHAEGHRRMMLAPDDPHNVAFALARRLQYAEEQRGLRNLVLYDYSGCRMLGDWLVQLYTESIQERGGGLNIIAARGPTSNHSLLNGIISGPRDKLILFIHWQDLGDDLHVPSDDTIGGGLEVFMNRSMNSLQEASFQGTGRDFARNGVPCLALSVARRDTAHLFLLMRALMDTVAVKGRLQGLHVDAEHTVSPARDLTYLQDGVEGYKQAMREYLAGEE